VKSEWFETFFDRNALDFWSQAIPETHTTKEADFLEKALAVQSGARLLDVPCGHGRHSIQLAERGYRMTGVDLSPDFLSAAKSSRAKVDWRQADMRHLQFDDASFDGAFCFGNSFGYLDYPSANAFLATLARALKPGARLVIDTPTVAEAMSLFAPKRWHRFGDLIVLSESRYEAEHSRLDIDYTFLRGGNIDTRPMSSYIFAAAEVRRMLESAGFEVVSLHGGVAGEPFKLGSPLVIIAMRR